tara:strand:+ start:299 stop:493 length:195 start_codon:yes stop_codon:yes gene_type:complete
MFTNKAGSPFLVDGEYAKVAFNASSTPFTSISIGTFLPSYKDLNNLFSLETPLKNPGCKKSNFP